MRLSDDKLQYLLFAAMLSAVVVAIVLYIEYTTLNGHYLQLLEYMNESCYCSGMWLGGIG